jgi:TonB family protein
MKTLALLSLTTLLVVNTLNSPQQPAPQESPELKEATTLTDSSIKLFNQGRYDQAIPMAKRALQIREKLLPRTDPRVVDSLSNLGEFYISTQDYKAAIEVFRRILLSQEERFGPGHVNVANTLERLAKLYSAAGNSREAEAAYQRALELREKGFGANSVPVAQTHFALAEFYRARSDAQNSAANYRRALTIFGQVSGIPSPDWERVTEGFYCLGYKAQKIDVQKEIEEVYRELGVPLPKSGSDATSVLNGRAVTLPKPEYPDAARERNLAGMVVVKVEIDESGNVIKARDMCQGPPFLSEAAVAAALTARFTPTKLDGKPIKVIGVIQYNFKR